MFEIWSREQRRPVWKKLHWEASKPGQMLTESTSRRGICFRNISGFTITVFSSSSSVSEDITLIVPQTKHGKKCPVLVFYFQFRKTLLMEAANMGDCGFLCFVQRSSLYLLWCERLVSHCKLSYFSALSMIKHLYLVVLGKTLLVA